MSSLVRNLQQQHQQHQQHHQQGDLNWLLESSTGSSSWNGSRGGALASSSGLRNQGGGGSLSHEYAESLNCSYQQLAAAPGPPPTSSEHDIPPVKSYISPNSWVLLGNTNGYYNTRALFNNNNNNNSLGTYSQSMPVPVNTSSSFLDSQLHQTSSFDALPCLPSLSYHQQQQQQQQLELMSKRQAINNMLAASQYGGEYGMRIGLDLGGRTYFSTAEDMLAVRLNLAKRPRTNSQLPPPMCQAQGCKADLSTAKHYHRRHKVCEMHSKASTVTANGQTQRFCQQCSRFHALTEFDEGKRSCRKRLADHNRRRRKPQPSNASVNPVEESSSPAKDVDSTEDNSSRANNTNNEKKSQQSSSSSDSHGSVKPCEERSETTAPTSVSQAGEEGASHHCSVGPNLALATQDHGGTWLNKGDLARVSTCSSEHSKGSECPVQATEELGTSWRDSSGSVASSSTLVWMNSMLNK